MSKQIYFSSLLLLFFIKTFAQQVRPETSASIYRDIETIQHLPKVLYIAAHPDDENTGLLTWLVNGAQVQTAYLSLTRGDGGQNILGNEQGAALGLIRTHELLDARALDGAQQFFSRAIDFGFSKNWQDTYAQWNVDSIVNDVVWVIRKYRPDIIICRFPPNTMAGHGQHAASAIAAAKAFDLSGDKNAFPQQLKYVKPWQPKRLLWNAYNSDNTASNNLLQLIIGEYDSNLGMGYGELAGKSRSMHKSQGEGTPAVAGIKSEYFSLVKGEPATHSLFDGLDTSWTSIQLPEIDHTISQILSSFNFNRPDESLPSLLKIRTILLQHTDKEIVNDKLQILDKVILSCAGFMAEAVTDQPQAIAGNSYNFRLNAIARSSLPVILESVQWLNEKETIEKVLSNDIQEGFSRNITIPQDAHITEPYWLSNAPATPVEFSVPNDTLIGYPEAPSALNAIAEIKIGDQHFTVTLPLSYKKLDPVKGDVIEQLRIVPAMNISFQNRIYFLKDNEDSLHVNIRFQNNGDKDLSGGTLTLKKGNKILSTFKNISFSSLIDIKSFSIKKSLLAIDSSSIGLSAVYNKDGKDYDKEQHIISYPHIPTLQYFTPANATILQADMKITAKKIGYIPGAGDFFPQFLNEAGLDIEILKPEDILDSNKLNTFDAIVTGVRIVNVQKQFPLWYPYLMNYIKQGGTLIMQYQRLENLSLRNFGPYPFTVENKRVTEENSDVKFLHPEDRLMNYPNKITPDDFKGWVQERGAYFAGTWDNNYTPLFEMHDTNEAPLQGSTIYARYGKGCYIYTSLSFFRQLPLGNMGAVRLFYNFLSAGK
ncbi:MAG: PIG-L family deacetylase [Arachidicoccus sp.]|nr:PIG-L family deacetylase [Arachidicoccus sp.]